MQTNLTPTSLPKKLQELRGERTQCAVARALEMKQQTYSRWEKGDRQPKLEDLCRIAKYFRVTTDCLLGLSAAPNGASDSEWQDKAMAAERKLERVSCALKHALKGFEELQEALK